MPIDRTSFDAISDRDLVELIDGSVPEGLTIEYKSRPYDKSHDDRREALKDITAFANSHGGHLVIGIREEDGLPVELTGFSPAEADELQGRLESLMRDGVEPRMIGVRVKP